METVINTSSPEVFSGSPDRKIHTNMNESEISHLHSRLREMEDLNRQLMIQLKDARASEENLRAASVADKDAIVRLEQRVTFLEQDLSSEASQRQRIQTNNKDLQLELTIVQRQLAQYQQIQMENITQRRIDSLNRYKQEYQQKHQQYNNLKQNPPLGSLGGHHLVQEVDNDEMGYDTVDHGPISSYPPVPADTSLSGQPANLNEERKNQKPNISLLQRLSSDGDSVKSEQEDTFQCPTCSREFLVSDTDEFLSHVEGCT